MVASFALPIKNRVVVKGPLIDTSGRQEGFAAGAVARDPRETAQGA
jgi:hypothetical protein